jgi:thiol-disulfide isomerase/thioredoxin
MKRTILIGLLCVALSSTASLAQKGIHVSDSDPKWGEMLTVTYEPSDTTASKEEKLYCALIATGSAAEHAIVKPMEREGAQYQLHVAVPTGTSAMQIYIGTPKKLFRDGMTSFTCRTSDGKPTPGYFLEGPRNVDSTLALEVANYPTNYRAYFRAYDYGKLLEASGMLKRDKGAWNDTLAAYIQRIEQTKDQSLEKWIVLAALAERMGDEKKAATFAVETNKHAQTESSILRNESFWGRLFYPQQVSGKFEVDHPFGRAFLPLMLRYPKSAMTNEWLHSMGHDSLVSTKDFHAITAAWSTSKNVDALQAIASIYADTTMKSHDLREALTWARRASDALTSGSGFMSGEYVYGYGGRIGWVGSLMIKLLAANGKLDEAIAYQKKILPDVEGVRDKKSIAEAMSNAYLKAGRKENAEQSSQIEYPAVPDFNFASLDGMSSSLYALRGKVVVLDCWFTTCVGCEIEKESLGRLADSFKSDTNVVFLSIALDGTKSLATFFGDQTPKMHVIPYGNSICERIGVTGYPTHIIIDRAGRTVTNDFGGSEHTDEKLRPVILAALARSSAN